MTRLTWNESGSRFYEAGVDRGVLYPKDQPGVPWNGLVSVEEAPSGVEARPRYWDGIPYQDSRSGGSFTATISAFTYPREFEEYDGLSERIFTRQTRKSFGFAYRTKHGTDENPDHGYRIHLVYNAHATPSERAYSSLDTDIEAMLLSWEIETTPFAIAGLHPSAHLIVDSTAIYPWALASLEDILYGSELGPPRLPSPSEIVKLIEDASIVQITDNGDGTWTAEGPDDVVYLTDSTTFEIDWPSAVYIDDQSYSVSSL